MPQTVIIHLRQTNSTNDYLRTYHGERGELMTIVIADSQSAGRGQGTHTWESQPGKNILASISFDTHELPAQRQFAILQAMALAVRDTLTDIIGETDRLTIKWPNDIYYKDSKISGTLSECEVRQGTIQSCIIGIGLNVNQQTFLSDAPNPVSLRQITGEEHDISETLDALATRARTYIYMLRRRELDQIDQAYRRHLYRRSGRHAYQDTAGTFQAEIAGIETTGHLLLRDNEGTIRQYAFGEVKAII